jgi:hypothetical protein
MSVEETKELGVKMVEAEWISNRGMSVIGDVEMFEIETFKRLKDKGMVREVGVKEAETRGSKSVANKK